MSEVGIGLDQSIKELLQKPARLLMLKGFLSPQIWFKLWQIPDTNSSLYEAKSFCWYIYTNISRCKTHLILFSVSASARMKKPAECMKCSSNFFLREMCFVQWIREFSWRQRDRRANCFPSSSFSSFKRMNELLEKVKIPTLYLSTMKRLISWKLWSFSVQFYLHYFHGLWDKTFGRVHWRRDEDQTQRIN